jgi:hypothetical protein
MAKNSREHQALVQGFFADKQAEDPEGFAALCERYPVLSPRQWRTIREKETSFSDLSRREAQRYGEDGDDNMYDD